MDVFYFSLGGGPMAGMMIADSLMMNRNITVISKPFGIVKVVRALRTALTIELEWDLGYKWGVAYVRVHE
jgi:hypothetical protein